MRVAAGSVDQSVIIRIVDSADGTPEEGVTSASGGLALWYWRMGSAVVAITESDLAAIDSAHSDGGMKHADDGYYRVDIPDAAFVTGAARVTIGGTVTGMVVVGMIVEIGPVVANTVQVEGGDATDAITTAATASLNTYDPSTKAELDAGLASSDDAVLAVIAALNNLSVAQVDTALATYDSPTRAELTSDIASLATFIDTEVASILTDTGTDIPATLAIIVGYLDTEVAAALAAVDTEVAAIKVITDALTAVGAAKLALSSGVILAGSAIAGTLSTTSMTTDLTEITNDHFNGRIVIFTSGVLQYQATDITDYDGATRMLTFTALTEAPTAGDDFIIV